MLRKLIVFAMLAVAAEAATVRLYLKDGTYHSVREYKTLPDRVRFYSTERGDWEEIPLELVDLKRTESEIQSREQQRREDAAALDAEEKAEREQRREIERIPMESGVFVVKGDKVTVFKQAETKVVNNKRRSVLKAMSPIPVVSGKSTIEIDGLNAATVLNEARPELYIRLGAEERFHIARVSAGKNARIVQKWNIIPVTKEIVEETDIVEVFRKQLADGLYKIWPMKPLTPGEYAVIEFTEGKGNIQVWDFAVSQ
jgi:hypothetical protein